MGCTRRRVGKPSDRAVYPPAETGTEPAEIRARHLPTEALARQLPLIHKGGCDLPTATRPQPAEPTFSAIVDEKKSVKRASGSGRAMPETPSGTPPQHRGGHEERHLTRVDPLSLPPWRT